METGSLCEPTAGDVLATSTSANVGCKTELEESSIQARVINWKSGRSGLLVRKAAIVSIGPEANRVSRVFDTYFVSPG